MKWPNSQMNSLLWVVANLATREPTFSEDIFQFSFFFLLFIFKTKEGIKSRHDSNLMGPEDFLFFTKKESHWILPVKAFIFTRIAWWWKPVEVKEVWTVEVIKSMFAEAYVPIIGNYVPPRNCWHVTNKENRRLSLDCLCIRNI